ncbi:probable beta-D-xylosidase 2 [Lingula anatina]|uniref:Probable beta-D-xylosidase 2 n=1 Tax=Lingula anatina TaxID=7574 RepID=A0A1S3H2T8_LINAN|nr:probable beta-D-xylosidase 2 [Lingula anatina]|eukprot:XP_013379796.1 probable beta-D-xylosidase 2 [Lingula anatina]
MAVARRVLVAVLVTFHFYASFTFDYPFRNTSLPWADRVNDLVDRLTLEEIILQMAKGGAGPGGPAPAIPRLGIAPHQWNNECLRGVGYGGTATTFPQALGLAAAFSTDLIFRVARASATEARAKYNDNIKKGNYGDHTGISCFAPVINIMRHPYWGRNQETYGEDPYFSGVYSQNFVHGLQGQDPRYVLANACCKHFDVHGGPENIPVSRFGFDAKVSERDFRTTFLPAFKACVGAGSYSVMCSYNRLNGIPTCANKKLLTDILRKEWNFTGYVVSDEGAIENIISYHKYLKNPVDTVAACVNAGTNLELSPNLNATAVYMSMGKAIEAGKLTKDTVTQMVKPLFYTRMRLGEFDPPQMVPYSKYDLSYVESREHRDLAVEAAAKSFVLLKNAGRVLPLQTVLKSVAIIGPMANASYQIYGDYSAPVDTRYFRSPLQGLTTMAQKVFFAQGCDDLNPCTNYNPTAVINAAAQNVDAVVICAGIGWNLESEGKDRSSLELPGNQSRLIMDAASAASGKPVILLLFNAGPVNVQWAKDSSKVSAILACFYPAQAAGDAIIQVLWNQGAHGNPAARLPATWPANDAQVPPITNYTMIGRTYRYWIGPGDPLFPYGYGLSYTEFMYSDLIVPVTVRAGNNATIAVNVTNIGSLPGDEVIQIYIMWMDSKVVVPRYQLAGFARVNIQKGQTVTHKFVITAEQMAVWEDNKGFVVEPGRIKVYAGGQQPNQFTHAPSNVLEAMFTIV